MSPRAPDVLQHRQTLQDVFLGAGGAQRVVKVRQSFEHPRLAAPVPHLCQAVEERVAHRLVGRERGAHEREPRLAIGILGAGELLVENLAPRGNAAHRKFERQ